MSNDNNTPLPDDPDDPAYWEAREKRAREALASSEMEADMFDMPIEQIARKKLIDASAVAADQIINIAVTGTEQGRLAASRYIMDRTFGKVTDKGYIVDESQDPIKKLMDKLTATGAASDN